MGSVHGVGGVGDGHWPLHTHTCDPACTRELTSLSVSQLSVATVLASGSPQPVAGPAPKVPVRLPPSPACLRGAPSSMAPPRSSPFGAGTPGLGGEQHGAGVCTTLGKDPLNTHTPTL